MSQNCQLPKVECYRCPMAQDFQDILEDYTDYLSTVGKTDVRRWADYHRGSHRARITMAKSLVKELIIALEGNGRQEQDRDDL